MRVRRGDCLFEAVAARAVELPIGGRLQGVGRAEGMCMRAATL